MPLKRKYEDDIDYARFIGWHRARAQAHYRNEEWKITEAQWFDIWTRKKWQQRGRGANDLCLIRKDNTKSWSIANIEMVTRKQQLGMREEITPWWQSQYAKYCKVNK